MIAATRITLWGQSAGAASVDFNNFAFYDNPIVTGFFGQSGTAMLPITSADTTHSNFSFVASQLGCDHSNPAKELECMRQVSWEDIEAFVGGYTDNGTMPAVAFGPIPDEKIIFPDYPKRYKQNKVSQRPAIFSNCQDEGNSLVTYHHSGIDEKAARELTLNAFLCPSTETSKLRTQAGLTTYRYEYAGNFSNVSPLPWMGPYHASDLPMLFATHQDYTNGEGHSTPFEYAVSERMEDLVFSFMLDPESGPEKHGWPNYASGKMLKFGADGKVMQTVSVQSVDGVCSAQS
jgi:carboxylesterase type B